MSTDEVMGSPGAVPPDVLRPGFQAWLALVHSYGSVAKTLDRRLTRDLDVSLAWFEALVLLYTAPGGKRRLLELSRLLVVSKASVSKLIDRMERAGLVRREASEEDRRAVYAVLTDEGVAALGKALPLQVANVDECFADLLDDRDLADLVRILGKVTAHYENMEPSTPSTPSTRGLSGSPSAAAPRDKAAGVGTPAARSAGPGAARVTGAAGSAGSPADTAEVERLGGAAAHPLRKRA
jgi:DNA-binding MarR family transcriptional regulator